MKSWLLLVTLALTVAVAIAGGPIGSQPCVAVEFTLHSYSGPITISDACLSAPTTYDGTVLRIEAVDAGDNLFHGDFEQ